MRIAFTPRAAKELQHLDGKTICAFKEALLAFSIGQKCDVKKMKGFSNRYRIRVREYRAVFDVLIQENAMYVLRIAHRREAYKNL